MSGAVFEMSSRFFSPLSTQSESIHPGFPFLRTPLKSPHLNARTKEHLSLDPVMTGLIERIGPIHLRARRVPVFQSHTS